MPAPPPAAAAARRSTARGARRRVAAALGQDDRCTPRSGCGRSSDVTIRPMPPKPSLFIRSRPRRRHPQQPEMPNTFIPPQPERGPAASAHAADRGAADAGAARNPQASVANSATSIREKQRMSLLQRLAIVGLAGRDENRGRCGPSRLPRCAPMPQRMERMPPRPAARPMEEREPVSEYAGRPGAAGPRPAWPAGACA